MYGQAPCNVRNAPECGALRRRSERGGRTGHLAARVAEHHALRHPGADGHRRPGLRRLARERGRGGGGRGDSGALLRVRVAGGRHEWNRGRRGSRVGPPQRGRGRPRRALLGSTCGGLRRTAHARSSGVRGHGVLAGRELRSRRPRRRVPRDPAGVQRAVRHRVHALPVPSRCRRRSHAARNRRSNRRRQRDRRLGADLRAAGSTGARRGRVGLGQRSRL